MLWENPSAVCRCDNPNSESFVPSSQHNQRRSYSAPWVAPPTRVHKHTDTRAQTSARPQQTHPQIHTHTHTHTHTHMRHIRGFHIRDAATKFWRAHQKVCDWSGLIIWCSPLGVMLNFDARIKNSEAAQPRVTNVKTPIVVHMFPLEEAETYLPPSKRLDKEQQTWGQFTMRDPQLGEVPLLHSQCTLLKNKTNSEPVLQDEGIFTHSFLNGLVPFLLCTCPFRKRPFSKRFYCGQEPARAVSTAQSPQLKVPVVFCPLEQIEGPLRDLQGLEIHSENPWQKMAPPASSDLQWSKAQTRDLEYCQVSVYHILINFLHIRRPNMSSHNQAPFFLEKVLFTYFWKRMPKCFQLDW